MGKIILPADCGNAPKKLFLKEWYSALASSDATFIANYIADQVHWCIPGKKSIIGKADCIQRFPEHPIWNAKEITIDAIITHGREAAVSGQLLSAKRSKNTFCEVFRFKSAGTNIIASITSFIIPV